MAYAGEKRTDALPDVPTLIESGVKNYKLYYWVAVYAPHGSPRDVIAKLNKSFVEEVKNSAIKAIFNNAMLDSFTTTPEGLADVQKSETETWGRVIIAAGITPE